MCFQAAKEQKLNISESEIEWFQTFSQTYGHWWATRLCHLCPHAEELSAQKYTPVTVPNDPTAGRKVDIHECHSIATCSTVLRQRPATLLEADSTGYWTYIYFAWKKAAWWQKPPHIDLILSNLIEFFSSRKLYVKNCTCMWGYLLSCTYQLRFVEIGSNKVEEAIVHRSTLTQTGCAKWTFVVGHCMTHASPHAVARMGKIFRDISNYQVKNS